jgi:hypothetical protein
MGRKRTGFFVEGHPIGDSIGIIGMVPDSAYSGGIPVPDDAQTSYLILRTASLSVPDNAWIGR